MWQLLCFCVRIDAAFSSDWIAGIELHRASTAARRHGNVCEVLRYIVGCSTFSRVAHEHSAESDLGDKVLESDANEDLSGSPWVVAPDNTHWVRTLKMTKRSSLVTCHVTQTQRFRMISET